RKHRSQIGILSTVASSRPMPGQASGTIHPSPSRRNVPQSWHRRSGTRALEGGSLEVVAFLVPCRKAPNMEVIGFGPLRRAIVRRELQVVFDLAGLEGCVTDGAIRAAACVCPHAVRAAVGQPPSLDQLSGSITERTMLVHGRYPSEAPISACPSA